MNRAPWTDRRGTHHDLGFDGVPDKQQKTRNNGVQEMGKPCINTVHALSQILSLVLRRAVSCGFGKYLEAI